DRRDHLHRAGRAERDRRAGARPRAHRGRGHGAHGRAGARSARRRRRLPDRAQFLGRGRGRGARRGRERRGLGVLPRRLHRDRDPRRARGRRPPHQGLSGGRGGRPGLHPRAARSAPRHAHARRRRHQPRERRAVPGGRVHRRRAGRGARGPRARRGRALRRDHGARARLRREGRAALRPPGGTREIALRDAVRRALLPALLLALSLAARPARAGSEEFSTFHTNSWEEDDESVIDHVLARLPDAWRDEWERAPLALRTAQGCLTSGQWFMNTQLKLETALGKRARLAIAYTDVEGDVVSYQYFDLWARFPTRAGTLGVMFRPFHDKARQDFALAWELGSDTTAFRLRVTWGFEDLFNNLWAFRQSR